MNNAIIKGKAAIALLAQSKVELSRAQLPLQLDDDGMRQRLQSRASWRWIAQRWRAAIALLAQSKVELSRAQLPLQLNDAAALAEPRQLTVSRCVMRDDGEHQRVAVRLNTIAEWHMS